MLISGEAERYHLAERGEREPDDTFMLILNATDDVVEYVLTESQMLSLPIMLIDTSRDTVINCTEQPAVSSCRAAPHSFVLIQYSSVV